MIMPEKMAVSPAASRAMSLVLFLPPAEPVVPEPGKKGGDGKVKGERGMEEGRRDEGERGGGGGVGGRGAKEGRRDGGERRGGGGEGGERRRRGRGREEEEGDEWEEGKGERYVVELIHM